MLFRAASPAVSVLDKVVTCFDEIIQYDVSRGMCMIDPESAVMLRSVLGNLRFSKSFCPNHMKDCSPYVSPYATGLSDSSCVPEFESNEEEDRHIELNDAFHTYYEGSAGIYNERHQTDAMGKVIVAKDVDALFRPLPNDFMLIDRKCTPFNPGIVPVVGTDSLKNVLFSKTLDNFSAGMFPNTFALEKAIQYEVCTRKAAEDPSKTSSFGTCGCYLYSTASQGVSADGGYPMATPHVLGCGSFACLGVAASGTNAVARTRCGTFVHHMRQRYGIEIIGEQNECTLFRLR